MNDHDAANAIANAVRAQVLAKMGRKVWSPKDLAKELDMPLANISYHVRILHKLGAIKLVDTKPRRGATEHFYKAAFSIKVTVKELT